MTALGLALRVLEVVGNVVATVIGALTFMAFMVGMLVFMWLLASSVGMQH